MRWTRDLWRDEKADKIWVRTRIRAMGSLVFLTESCIGHASALKSIIQCVSDLPFGRVLLKL